MALQKQSVYVNFQGGLDQKIDPLQIPTGKFQELNNSVFDKVGRMTKRNGFGSLPSLPDSSSSYLTTFNGNLTAIGKDLKAYASGPMIWVNKGGIEPLELSTLDIVKNSTNQLQSDTAFATNGLVCIVYADSQTAGSATVAIQKYSVCDATTGQNIISPSAITSTFGTVTISSKVFTLGNNFVVVLTSTDGATYRLQYFTISTAIPSAIGSVTDFATNYAPAAGGTFDGTILNNNLVISYNASGNAGVQAKYLTRYLGQSSAVTIASSAASVISMCSDVNNSVAWSSFYFTGSSSGATVALSLNSGSGSSQSLGTLFTAKRFASSSISAITNIASTAQAGVAQIAYEVTNSYSYDNTVPTNFINTVSCTQTGSLSASAGLIRSVGLASDGFLIGSVSYFLTSYSSPYQPTYFLIGSAGAIAAKLSYGNGAGYLTLGLPSVYVSGSFSAQFSIIKKDLVQAVNKDTNVAAGTQTAGIYSQTGVTIAKVIFGTGGLTSVETAGDLHVNGGYLSMYDGYQPVEHMFHVYPDSVKTTASGSIGSMTVQTYFYQATYEWADNQGNLFRSAPSIPVTAVIGTTTATARVVVNVPTLRLTHKTLNPPKIVIYRWSTAQQVYYQVTSITQPILNNKTADSISFTDVYPDSAILGNNIIYTNGGVLENIAAPAVTGMTTFDSRLWLIDAEDPNLLWFSKQVIESTPVETSDLLTVFVPPGAGAQGNTGPMKCLAPMDDKLIIFKKNAIYYLNGIGPDNTGANNQYSQPTFITSTVGCDNQNSIVMTPLGLMFQSDKGIWLLGRDLSTNYIGKDVEDYNSLEVESALTIPATNQVRFTLNSNVTLMYDYFVNQWGTFNNIPGISSTLYQDLHTYINSRGQTFQETPGLYLDGSNPTLMSFKTGWLSFAGFQGYQRAYYMYVLGTYLTPHKLNVSVAYNYDSSVTQFKSITPTNHNDAWGDGVNWGSIPLWGGVSAREQLQFNFRIQQCQSIQVGVSEQFDSSFGEANGAGLTLSGLNFVVGFKKGHPDNIPSTNKT